MDALDSSGIVDCHGQVEDTKLRITGWCHYVLWDHTKGMYRTANNKHNQPTRICSPEIQPLP